MNRQRTPAWLLLAVLALVTASAGAMPPVETLKGQVSAVNVGAATLTVRLAGAIGAADHVSVKINRETKIIKGDSRIELSQVRMGDAVVVNYRTESGALVAISVGIQVGTV